MPGYQPAMMPAPVPMMPAMGAVPAMPGKARWQVPSQVGAGRREVLPGGPGGASGRGAMCKLGTCMPPAAMVMPPQLPPAPQPLLPSMDPRQLAAQQQSFINQQALLLVRVGGALRAPLGAGSAGPSPTRSYRARRLSPGSGPADDHPGHDLVAGTADTAAPAPGSASGPGPWSCFPDLTPTCRPQAQEAPGPAAGARAGGGIGGCLSEGEDAGRV